MNTSVEKILHEVKKVIAGKDDVLEKIMMTVLSRGHVLLDDVPVPERPPPHWPSAVRWVCSTGVSSSRRMCCPRTSWVSPCTIRRAAALSISPAQS